MARNRMVKPEFWEDEKIGSLSFGARLLFLAMLNFADDEGYLSANKKWLQVKCFPYNPEVDISVLLKELLELNILSLKNDIFLIKNFLKHQKIDHPTKSTLKERFGEDSVRTREDSSLKEVKLKEVKIKEDNIKERIVKERETAETSTPASLLENQVKVKNLTAQLIKTIPKDDESFETKRQRAVRQVETLMAAEVAAEKLN